MNSFATIYYTTKGLLKDLCQFWREINALGVEPLGPKALKTGEVETKTPLAFRVYPSTLSPKTLKSKLREYSCLNLRLN